MFAIIGLGNYEAKYDKTYHNTGFMAVDVFAAKNGLKFTQKKYNAMCATGVVSGEKVVLLKPLTYMNLSGNCVSEVVRKLKLPLSNILVVYDDIDLPVGEIRYRTSGSSGTHNGMRDVVLKLKSSEFARIRIGIGKDERMDLADYVTSKVSKVNWPYLETAFDGATDIISEYISSNGKLEGKTIK